MLEKAQKVFFGKIFLWMFMGLFATGLISVYTYSSGLVETLMKNGGFAIALIAELVLVLVFTFLFRKLPPMGVKIVFIIYSVINGITLSTIFYSFEIKSIIIVFFAAALCFGIFALLGYFTKLNLTKLGPIFMITLIVGLVVSVINIFIGNSMLDLMISWVILLTFFGITAYDMQKLKALGQQSDYQDEKMYIYGAMELYLDFINIFIRLLSIFGNRRD